MNWNPFRKKNNGGPPSYIHVIAVPLILGGMEQVAPAGYKDLLLHSLDKAFGLHIDFGQSVPLGIFMMLSGLAVYLLERIIAQRSAPHLFALRHQSFPPTTPDIDRQTFQFALLSFETFTCDVSASMDPRPPNVEFAVLTQLQLLTRFRETLSSHKSSVVAYYGIVHIPFQFFAGMRFLRHVKLHLFELDRHARVWRELGSGPSTVCPRTHILAGPVDCEHALVAISVSFAVPLAVASLPIGRPHATAELWLDNPSRSAIKTYADISTIRAAFRKMVDDPRIKGKILHIFYSGPVSLGVSLGQELSPTIHGQSLIYNWNASVAPPYSWALDISESEAHVRVRHF